MANRESSQSIGDWFFSYPKKLIPSVFFEDIFPEEFFQDDVYIRRDGKMAVGLNIDTPVRGTIGYNFFYELIEKLVNQLNQQAPGTILHEQRICFEDSFNPYRADPPKGYVTSQLAKYYQDRSMAVEKKKYYLCFNFSADKKDPMNTFLATFRGYSKNSKFDEIDKNLGKVKSYTSAFIAGLKSTSLLSAKQMTKDEFLQNRIDYFNLSFKKQYNTFTGNIYSHPNGVTIGNKHLKVIFLNNLGSETHYAVKDQCGGPAPMSYVLGTVLPFPHIVNTSVMVVDKDKELKELDSNRKKINNIDKKSSVGGDDDANFDENVSIWTKTVRNENIPIALVAQNVMVWDEDPKRVDMYVSEVINAFQNMNGSQAITDSFNNNNYYFTQAPGMAGDILHPKLEYMRKCVAHFDLTSPRLSEQRGIMLVNRHTNEPVLVDLWPDFLQAKNRIIVAPTGAGKSFTVNVLMGQSFDQGSDVILIDVGGSYKNLDVINKGKYFEYSAEKPIKTNPFATVRRNRDGSYDVTSDKLVYLLTILSLTWKDSKNNETLSKEEQAILTEYIRLYYIQCEQDKTVPRFDRFIKFVEDLTSPQKVKSNPQRERDLKFFNRDSFLLVMEKFCTGSYKDILNAETTDNIADHRMITFDLLGVKEDPIMFPVVAVIIIELILDKIRLNPTKRKEILIDEAWSMLKGNLANFIEYMFRTIRKNLGACTIITQGVTEIMGSEVGEAIKGNSPVKIILDHSSAPEQLPNVQKFFAFPDHFMDLIVSIQKTSTKRDIVLIRGEIAEVFNIDVGPVLGLAFSSWSDDKLSIAKMAEDKGIEYALNQYAYNKNLK